MSRDNDDEVLARIRNLLVRADDVRKAAPQRARPEVAWEQAAELIDEARAWVEDLEDDEARRTQAAAVSRRAADLDLDALAPMLEPSPDVARAPTRVDDPARVPPGQHLTAGWPVLHVGDVPDLAPEDVKVTVTGRVHERQVLSLADLQCLPTTTVIRDLHCVTRWTRLDNAWTGVRVREVLDLARPRPEATHAIVSGHPAYSTNLDLAVLRGDDVLLAWAHDGGPLPPAHGGPLRLVVPSRYGWKSVKWVTEVRLTERDVPGYWEERGYHDVADPWREQRFRDDR
jgi:DMSO/TMAO reductase YedYZ molybdopterin-dependent catalytic subunit